MPQTRQSQRWNSKKDKSQNMISGPISTFACDLKTGDYFPFHVHEHAQLVYASRGVLKVTTRAAVYIVPPQRAVWIPKGIEHRIDVYDKVSMRSLYINSAATNARFSQPSVIMVSPLLRELILTAVSIGNEYSANSPQSRIMEVILDQIVDQSDIALALPLPTDQRLLLITQSLIKNPSDNRKLEEWANTVGASKRTLNRLFMLQTNLSFQRWRQQLRLHQGIELLSIGQSVTRVALDLGYQNTSSFIAMFRRCLGTTPTEYLRTTGHSEFSETVSAKSP